MNSLAEVPTSRAGRHLLQYLHDVTAGRWSIEQRPRGVAFPISDPEGTVIAYLCLAEVAEADRYRRIGGTVAAALSVLLTAEPADTDITPMVTKAPEHSLFDGRLLAHFQPIVEFTSGSVVAVEALARLSSGSAILGPEAFLHAIDTPPAMLALFDRMLDDSLAFIADQRVVVPHLGAAVKFEFDAVPATGFAERIAGRLKQYDVPPERLTLELQERGAFTLGPQTARALQELAELGVQLVISDIDQCHTLMDEMPRLPIAGTKLRRRYVSRLTDGEAEVEQARVLLARATDRGVDVIADGVETRGQIEQLLRLGCRFGLGYLFAVPQPGTSLADVIDMPLLASR
jgi:EAL domain-containing protein (putative c-di-GMP-specific phosphodiesterase class I)